MSDDPNRNGPIGDDPTEPLIVPASDLPGTNPAGPDPDPGLPPTEVMAAQVPPSAAVPPPSDPNTAIPGDEPPKWYENRAAVGGIIAVGLIGLFLLIAWLLWWSDDDDQSLVADSTTTSTVASSTIPPASVVDVEPLPTVETTEATTTTSTTTTTTTTSTTTTTVPATTAPATTVAATTAPTTAAPTTVATTTTVPVVTVPPGPSATVLDIIEASPDLSRLNQLIQDAGLGDDLSGAGPVTLFAPSNPAIDTLEAAPGGADLLADPDRLRTLLLRHVVPESLDGAAVFAVTELTTVEGATLAVDSVEQTVDGAMLLVTDVEGANGFLHVVDKVLIDPAEG